MGESDRIIARECQKNSAFIIGEKWRSLFCQFINGVILHKSICFTCQYYNSILWFQ